MGIGICKIYLLAGLLAACLIGLGQSGVLAQKLQREASLPPNADLGQVLSRKHNCWRCHGAFGVTDDSTRPNLAGQHAGYLEKQLFAFRDAARHLPKGYPLADRHHETMESVSRNLSDQDIKHLAAYYAGLTCHSSREAMRLPVPDMARRCFRCHGVEGRAKYPMLPRLAGQHAPYITKQLFALRQSQWTMEEEDPDRQRLHSMMKPQSELLTDGDIYNLAAYFSHMRCR
ncbi:MAG: c-type cytochrome [Magnetovibrionaceae bacterium]